MTHRILLADDSVTIRRVVELTFSDEDVTIDSVGDGTQAIEHARAQRPDIIVSDVVMPGLNGYELCQQVKSDPNLQSVPFLFLKGTFESFDEEKARSCGADGFIVKPFESQELIAKVKSLIESAVPAPPAASVQPVPAVPARPASTPSSPEATLAPRPIPPPIPTMQTRPAPTPPAIPARPVLPIPQQPIRPVVVAPSSAPPAMQPPPSIHQSPPPPPAAAQAPSDGFDFGFDFGEAEEDRFGTLAARPSLHKEIASPLEPSGESDEDLWSEVSLRGSASDLLEARAPAGSAAGTDAEIVDLAEETAIDAPEVLFEDEAVFEEVTTARITPLSPPVAREEAPAATERTPGSTLEPTAAVSIDQAEIERIVASHVEAAVRKILEPIVSDLARAMIEEVAWEVIPDLAEAMIRSEIERVRQSTRTD